VAPDFPTRAASDVGRGVRVGVGAGVGAAGEGEVGAVVEPAANECGEEAGTVERPVDVDATAALPPPHRLTRAGGRCGARIGRWSDGARTRWRLRFGVHARPVGTGSGSRPGGGPAATTPAAGSALWNDPPPHAPSSGSWRVEGAPAAAAF